MCEIEIDKYERVFNHIKANCSNLFCCYCECVLTSENRTKEHIRPRSKVGKGRKVTFKNVHPCCWTCNQEKKNMYLNEYLGYLYSQYGIQDQVRLEIKIKNVKKLMQK